MNYELTDETIEYDGRTLYRIKALVDIPYHGVKAGDLGGFIENVENLTGNAWVSGNAVVAGNARVYGNAWVYGNAVVAGNAWVYGNAWVSGNARVFGNAKVFGNARVREALGYGKALVCGNAKVFDYARVSGKALVCGNAKVFDEARVYGDATVCGDARVYGNAMVCGNAEVYGNAKVFGDAVVFDKYSGHFQDAMIYGGAYGDTSVQPEVKEDNPHIISDQLLADLKLAACQFEQAEREWTESADYYGTPFEKLLQARAALEEAARAYAKQFNPL